MIIELVEHHVEIEHNNVTNVINQEVETQEPLKKHVETEHKG